MALLLAKVKGLADFSQSPAKTKVSCSQHTKHGTAEPFHFLHIGPMSDVTMSRKLCVADFGRDMPHWHCCLPKSKVWQISARAQPKPRFLAASTPSMVLLNHFVSSVWAQVQ
jgi:hypothetical protein